MTSCSGCSCIKNIDDGTKFCGTTMAGYQYGCSPDCCSNCNPPPYLMPSAPPTVNQTSTPIAPKQYANPLLLDTSGSVKMYDPKITPDEKPAAIVPNITTTTTTETPRWWFWVGGGVIILIILLILSYMMTPSAPPNNYVNNAGRNYNNNGMNSNYTNSVGGNRFENSNSDWKYHHVQRPIVGNLPYRY